MFLDRISMKFFRRKTCRYFVSLLTTINVSVKYSFVLGNFVYSLQFTAIMNDAVQIESGVF